MSIPINPLSKYQSYAYQQILIACDSTETAERLSDSNQYLDFLRSTDATRVNSAAEPYAKYAPYDVELGQGRTGKYCILINGMQDAEFSIKAARWYNTVVADAGNTGNQFSTMNAGGTMDISEPQGIRFMNIMAEVADQLQSDPSGLIFMLKTIFVGHRSPTFEEDGAPDPITNIKPMMFVITNIQGSFTETGGEYKLEYAGINHGLSKQRHVMYGADRVSIDIAKGSAGCEANTLKGALCQLQSQIGVIYDEYFDKVKAQVEKTTTPEGTKLKFDGRRVQYVIEAEGVLAGSEYIVSDFKDSATNTGETNTAGIISLGKEPSVEAAILAIAKRCPRLQEDLTNGDGNDTKNTKYVLKVASTVQSTDTDYKIIYKLRRVIESRDDLIAILASRRTDNPVNMSQKIRNNTLELDYMYTGRNTDIIDFNLNMEMGLVLFQNMATTENIASTEQSVSGGGVDAQTAEAVPINAKRTKSKEVVRGRSPVFMTQRVKEESIPHVRNPKRAIDFQELMNRHAALENLEAVVKIHGNPGLLNSVNKLPTEIVETEKDTDTYSQVETNSSAAEDPTKPPPNQDTFPYWETIPAIVKINIKMPSVFYGGARNGNDYSEPFWYEGYYYCYAIEQMFNGGEFTQQLHIISIPQNSVSEQEQKDVTQTDQVSQTERANVASDTAGAGSSVPPSDQSSTQNTTTPASDPDNMTARQYLNAHVSQ